ncbi:MAG TPA: inorganic diphosphatase [Polyangia bacterium]|nr:inorganic diphosphatase [Polyangia bacterium]
MSNPLKLPVEGDDKGSVRCIVETPRGSRAKFRYDPTAKLFSLSKELVTGLTYPYDWGFIPSTLGEDGDPSDVMLLHDVATYPGLMISANLVGVLRVDDLQDGKKIANPRLFAVPVNANREHDLDDVRMLSKRVRKELEKFFKQTAALESKEVEVGDWEGADAARQILDADAARYRHGQ